MYRTIDYQDEIQQVGKQVWHLVCSPFAWPLSLFMLGATSNPIIFTEIELQAMFGISFGIAFWVSIFNSIFGKDPSFFLQGIAALGVKWSVLCSICFSVYFLLFSFLIWWAAIASVPSLRTRFYKKCLRFCSYTGGDAIWGVTTAAMIPVATLTPFLLYAPLVPKLSFYIIIVRFFLIAIWQYDQLKVSLDEGDVHVFESSQFMEQ